MEYKKENDRNFLAILHHSLNFLGVVVLFVFFEIKTGKSLLSLIFLVILICAYGFLSAWAKSKKYNHAIFKKSFLIIFLTSFLAGILGGFVFLDKEFVALNGYWSELIGNILFFILIAFSLILIPFLTGYALVFIPRFIKKLLKKA